jgi:hypothetical protein
MKQKSEVKKPKDSVQIRARRVNALERLIKQLETKVKKDRIYENGKIMEITVPLSEKNIERIQNEISILKSRI